jgi:4-alpha-glucanotransferase
VIVPLQDILGLGGEARMNVPGTVNGNWEWQLDRELLTKEVANWLKKLALDSGRTQ